MAEAADRLQDAISDRYRIERELGRGGTATVYLAEDLKHHRSVAIKVLDPGLAAAIGPERFLREIETTAGLSHPQILPLHDSGVAGEFLYYVMPYVEGESLRERLTRERQLPLEDALWIFREVVDALDYAHSRRVVHRDIKPENILLSRGHALVADFGIARAIRAGGGSKLTETGLTLGTPMYMSPEQAAGDVNVDGRSDLYSLACVLYEMLAGQPPFTGATAESVIHQHLSLEPRSVADLRPTVPAGIARALGRALAKAPADRFQTGAAFAEALTQPIPSGIPTEPRFRRTRKVLLAFLAVVVPLAVWLATWLGTRVSGTARIHSLAVLPLANMSGDPDQLYFADGMTEELITELSQVAALRVISRASVMRYRDSPQPIPVVAHELHVDAVVQGSVRRAGDRVRISAQLVDARHDRNLWAESYDRESHEILALQAEVARDIARQVRAHLTPREHQRLSRVRSVDPLAHEAYLRGRFLLHRLDEARYREAEQFFEEAIHRDSTYAAAWAGLSHAYYWMSSLFIPALEAMPKARAAARRALALDPELGEAHATLGMVSGSYYHDWEDALLHLRRAVALNPNDATSHLYYAIVLMPLGRLEEALGHLDQAALLDPHSLHVATFRCYDLYCMGRYADALECNQEALQRDSTYTVTWYNIANCLTELGQYPRALDAARRAVRTGGLTPFASTILACAYARAGQAGRAREVMRGLLREPSGLLQYSYLARIYTAVGERDSAFAMLERALPEREEDMLLLRVEPAFGPLRDDPRFEPLMHRLGL